MTAIDGAPDLDVLSKRFTKFGQGTKQLKILVLNKKLDLSKPSSGIESPYEAWNEAWKYISIMAMEGRTRERLQLRS